ncbi:hypothetical protein [Streptomyces sp. NPDC087294]|uniref:hypothetical protein n=1 Tax=Streptomyces sp. NPDC087294 TaxID=3365777 RepID=UPI003800D07F
MATGKNTPEDPAPGSDLPSRPRKDGARLWLWRWVLAPRTTWQSRRLAAPFWPGMDADTAWTLARLARHPDEHVYLAHRLNGEGHSGGTAPGTRTP